MQPLNITINSWRDDPFFEFISDGIRVIYLIDRSVNNSQRKHLKLVSNNPDDFVKNFETIQRQKTFPEQRIYCSLNARNFLKARQIFETKQLESNYSTLDQSWSFYKNCYNNWVSALSKPEAKETKYWLIDIDFDSTTFDDEARQNHVNSLFKTQIKIYFQYKTKNGWHMIVAPFRILEGFKKENSEVKKDALVLLEY